MELSYIESYGFEGGVEVPLGKSFKNLANFSLSSFVVKQAPTDQTKQKVKMDSSWAASEGMASKSIKHESIKLVN